jgi:hypothetical protein
MPPRWGSHWFESAGSTRMALLRSWGLGVGSTGSTKMALLRSWGLGSNGCRHDAAPLGLTSWFESAWPGSTGGRGQPIPWFIFWGWFLALTHSPGKAMGRRPCQAVEMTPRDVNGHPRPASVHLQLLALVGLLPRIARIPRFRPPCPLRLFAASSSRLLFCALRAVRA